MQNSECQILRREFLGKTAMGIGAIAAASLLDRELTTHAAGPTAGHGLTGLHHPGKAKRVIYLFQSGGPSQLDLFDYKPLLNEQHGQHVPKSILGKQRVTLMTRHQKNFTCFGSPYQFSRHGDSGQWLSSAIPHMAKMADDWCFVKTVHSEPINHDPAMTFMQTGQQIPGRPALGSWLHYGLGSECEELPAYLVMTSGVTQQPLLSRYWHSGMLPARYQGVQLRSTGDPVLFLSNPTGMDHAGRGRIVEAINRLNRLQVERVGDPEIEARINAFEMAYKMQTVVPQIINFADEPQHILDMYGPDVVRPGTYAHQCLMARRLSERGVRFIQIFHAGWDQHRDLVNELNRQTQATDQATTALIQDLKQRGLLDETLVVWGGEFGRTAFTQDARGNKSAGRDHHPRCFTMALAGGGIRGGTTFGKTDDYGYNVAEDLVHVRDMHATLLHCLGIDHHRFTHRFQGLDARLTGVEPARVVEEILN